MAAEKSADILAADEGDMVAEPLLEEVDEAAPMEALLLGHVGEDGVEGDGGHGRLPSTCAPQATEATTSAPTA